MRVVVTGGAGFIGSHVVDALVERGDEVVVLDDLSTGRRENVNPRAALEVVDLRDASAVTATLRRASPEAICHQGAQTSVSRSVREPVLDAEVNALGTVLLVEAAAAVGVARIAFASTGGAIYGEIAGERQALVGDPLLPISPYACSKLAAEAYLGAATRTGRVRATILRYANVYGPRQDPHGEAGVVAIFSQRLLAGEPIVVNGMRVAGDAGCIRDYVHVQDVVRANLLALDGAIDAPIVNVCTGRGVSTHELASLIAREAGGAAEIGHGAPRAGDLERSVLAVEHDSRLAPRMSLEDGVRDTVAYFRTRPPVAPKLV